MGQVGINGSAFFGGKEEERKREKWREAMILENGVGAQGPPGGGMAEVTAGGQCPPYKGFRTSQDICAGG